MPNVSEKKKMWGCIHLNDVDLHSLEDLMFSMFFFSPLTSLQKLKSKANLSRYQCLYGKEWIWACCVSSTGSTGITSSWTNQQLMSHILCQCSISFMVAWNILCQAPKLDFEDSWGDRVFRQIRWKTSKKWGRQTGWTHKPDRKVDGQTDGERKTERQKRCRQMSRPGSVLAYQTDVHSDASGHFTCGSRFKCICNAYMNSLTAKSEESAMITIILLLSVINRRAGASVEQGFKCSFT